MNSQNLRIGFVGLGDMGGAIAQRIIDAGFPTTLWARKTSSLEPFRHTSAKVAASLQDLGRTADIVGVCVFNDDDVKQVVVGDGEGLLYGMQPGGIIALHSTVTPETCESLEKLGKARGITIIDAPVSGAREGAEQGTLCIMVGGCAEGYEKAKPVLASYGNVIEHLGGIGSGQRAKVLNNVLCFVHLMTASLAFGVGKKFGMNESAMQNVLLNSSGGSVAMGHLIHLQADPAWAAHALTMVEKDTHLYQQACSRHGIDKTALDQLAEMSIDMVSNLAQKE